MRFIFLGGCGRSGTTLVQKLLSAHSKIAGGPEFDHTRDLFLLYKKMTSDHHLHRQAYFYCRPDVKNAFRVFYESFFLKPISRKKEAVFFSEKTPTNIAVADLLLEIFPDALFLNIVRDGRDVLLSHKKVKARDRSGAFKGIAWTSWGICNLWNFSISRYLDLLRSKTVSHRVLSIRFETLVTDPEKELSDLLGHLNLEMEDHLLYPETLSSPYTRELLDDVWYSEEMYRQSFNRGKIGRWKSDLNFFDKFLSNTLMSENLVKLGYEVDSRFLTLRGFLINPKTRAIIRSLSRPIREKLAHHLYS